MKVLPFFLTHKQGQLSATKCTLFLAHGGKAYWQTEEPTVSEESLVEHYLKPNGFVWKRILPSPGIVYVEIDPEKTVLQDFYTWEESLKVPQKPECWRSYYFFKDPTGVDWFTGKTLQESELEGKPIQEIYEEIQKRIS